MGDRTRLLLPGSPEDPLVVVRSDFWNFQAVGLFDGDAACLVDPGIRPEDMALLASATCARHRPPGAPPRAITDVVLTHSHHDHVRGAHAFPGARLHLPRVAAEKPADARERIEAAKRAVDERLGIDDPDFRYPVGHAGFETREDLRVGELAIELHFLPGHSNCTSVVWVPALRTLLSADYLVSPGLPYCRWESPAFEAALVTLRRWVLEWGVERVVPSHHVLLEGRDAILAAIDADARAFDVMRAVLGDGDVAGPEEDARLRAAARAAAEASGRPPGGQDRQHLDNARRLLAAVRGGA